MNTHKANCRIVAQVLAAHGVKHVVFSPGSRNAPMILAAASAIRHHTVIIDERSAAFHALGMAQVTRTPVALVCTSGTALLNYAPAVAEAYYQGLPLIVVSADRPKRWIDQDDSQTLRQPEALANFVKNSYDIPDFAAADTDMQLYANRVANDAMIQALRRRRGPVHINVRLDEPLTGPDPEPLATQRIISCLEADDTLPEDTVRELAEKNCDKKILIVAGFMLPDSRLNKALLKLMSLNNIYLMHETISNLHLPGRHSAIDTILSTLSDDELKHMAPDVVITLGGALVSRYIKEYIRQIPAVEHWAVGHSHTTVDCFNALTLRIEAEPARFFSQFGKYMSRCKPQSDYRRDWEQLKKISLKLHNKYLDTAPWSDLKACQAVFDSLDESVNLQLSNGTSIRYAQICMNDIPHGCYCNRGVSGIDGSVSTAVGAASVYPENTVLLCGDMSMSYDIGALATHNIPERLKIIVLNNQGGGIFRFITTTSGLPERERYFCAPPKMSLQGIAKSYGFDYFRADNYTNLQRTLPIFLAPRLAPAILEIVTPGEIGGDVLRGYMKRGRANACADNETYNKNQII